MVKLLLAHGADVNARAKDGKTALTFAVARNHHDVVELLKRYGAGEYVHIYLVCFISQQDFSKPAAVV